MTAKAHILKGIHFIGHAFSSERQLHRFTPKLLRLHACTVQGRVEIILSVNFCCLTNSILATATIFGLLRCSCSLEDIVHQWWPHRRRYLLEFLSVHIWKINILMQMMAQCHLIACCNLYTANMPHLIYIMLWKDFWVKFSTLGRAKSESKPLRYHWFIKFKLDLRYA